MPKAARRFVAAMALLAAVRTTGLPDVAQAEPAVSPAGLPLDEVAIETAGGETFPFTVEMALTPSDQQQGLMFRETMADDAGMLFLFDPVRPVSFWMRNTYIPLDMIFIAPDGTILNIERQAEPLTDDPRPSAGPVRGVLEINGGLAELLGIAAGDRVLHEAFAGADGEPEADAAE